MQVSKLFLAAMAMLTVTTAAQADWGSYGEQSNSGSYNRSGDSYDRNETLKNGDVVDAVVVSVRQVTMEASTTAQTVGMGTGAVVGGVAGASIGKNNTTKTLGGLLGAIAGGVGGDMLGKKVGESDAAEVVVMLKSGKKLFVVQADGMQFSAGQRVFLLASSGQSTGGYYGQQSQATFRIAPNQSAN